MAGRVLDVTSDEPCQKDWRANHRDLVVVILLDIRRVEYVLGEPYLGRDKSMRNNQMDRIATYADRQ